MMEGLRQWLLGITLTAFAARLARQLAPEGREQAMVRLAGGLLVTLAILRPLGQVSWESPSLEAGAFRQETAALAEDYREERCEALSAIIAQRTAAYIWDKADRLGLTCQVEVTVAAGEDGIPLPDTVTITGAYDAGLSALIEEEVGIPAGKQRWLEESAWSGKQESG